MKLYFTIVLLLLTSCAHTLSKQDKINLNSGKYSLLRGVEPSTLVKLFGDLFAADTFEVSIQAIDDKYLSNTHSDAPTEVSLKQGRHTIALQCRVYHHRLFLNSTTIITWRKYYTTLDVQGGNIYQIIGSYSKDDIEDRSSPCNLTIIKTGKYSEDQI